MTRYAVTMTIGYEFDRPAGAGRQMLRILPARLAGQQMVTLSAVTISPPPLEERRFRDFFGTEVIELVTPPGLTTLEVRLEARVDRPGQGPGFDVSPPVARLAAELASIDDLGPDAPHHFLPPSPRIPAVPEIATFARSASARAATVREVVAALGAALHAHLRFDAEATEVDTPVAEAFAGQSGVCQDFAQIMICGLRALGVPAAYVSGYLRTLPPPGKPRLEGADAMHAWLRAWAGREAGWIDYDVTNACFVDADHIEIGFGRDYGDVAPVTGMLRADGAHRGRHAVDIAPL